MSIIDLECIKVAVFQAVEDALKSGAEQHEYNIEEFNSLSEEDKKSYNDRIGLLHLANCQPETMTIQMEWYWPNKSKSSLCCKPSINLKNNIR